MRKQGSFLVEDYYLLTGGLNTNDSPFVVQPTQATDGQNFDYIRRGGIQKRAGHGKLNSSALAELKTIGWGLFNPPNASRIPIRFAGTKIQHFDFDAHTTTNLTEDTTAAGSTFLDGLGVQPVVTTMFTGGVANELWCAGGGMSQLYGVVSSTKVTANGVPAPTASSFTATGATTGGTLTAGNYRYTLTYRKTTTQAESNGTVEATGNVASGTTGSVALAWTLTNNDTTKYDKIFIYRSSVNGSSQFTAGVLVAEVASSATSYSDTGTFLDSSIAVPRANNLVIDNSQLPSGTYKPLTLFKRRLVTASGSTVRFSDTDKPESWPTYQTITVPSGGEITGLAIVSLTSPLSTDIDEALCVFKQTEMWVITGTGVLDSNSIPNWSLKFVDNSGVVTQPVVVSANGYITYVNYRGFFMWNGSGKPTRINQTIKDMFFPTGNIDKSKLNMAFGVFSQYRNEIAWYLSGNLQGEQQYVLKLDIDLTIGGSQNAFGGVQLNGAFTPDVLAFPAYAGMAFLSAPDAVEETIYLGDASGYVYSAYSDTSDGGSDITFQYVTPYLNQDTPGTSKRYNKLVVWVLDNGEYNLQVDFWSDYRFQDSEASAMSRAVSTQGNAPSNFIWDESNWDEGYWDASSNKVRALVYNFNSDNGNLEGDCIRLRFSESSNLQTPIIYGFSIFFTEVGLRK